jgi:IstB-like ATP binding protein
MIAEPAHLEQMLARLKLTAIRDQLDSLLDEAAKRELTLRETLTLFCEREIARKDERRIEMAFGLAKFPFVRDLAGFDFKAQPSLDPKQIRDLASGRFVANGERPCCCSARQASARPISPSRSDGPRSSPATRSCSSRRRRWWRRSPGRTARDGSRTSSRSSPSRGC